METHQLFIDLETYSEIPLDDAGAARYVDDASFEILLFAYSVDGEPVQVIDCTADDVPAWLVQALHDPHYVKHAFNASFEWTCLSKYYGRMPPEQWRCTMIHSWYCGYAGSLGTVGAAMGLPEDKQKLATGKALIRYFSKPCKATKSNGMRLRNYPWHDREKWELFKVYCGQDVVTEMEIARRLAAYPVPGAVQKQWETDLLINARGVAVDMDMCEGALAILEDTSAKLKAEAQELTGLHNPNSVRQLMDWINREEPGLDVKNLQKDTVSVMLAKGVKNPKVKRMLEIRQELGKTSTSKYVATEECVCSDGRVKGLLQFYGATRTGRWAGRLVQVQNLPRTYVEPLDFARRLVIARKGDALGAVYGSVPDTLSQLIRTVFVATPGNKLIDMDFSAIEARVISWLAGEEWRLEVFRTHGKIYEASASQMFHIPIERIKKGNPEYAYRARGKVAELALGYQGGVGAMRRMDVGHNLDDLTDDEVQEIVNRWRVSNSKIRELWYAMESAAIKVIQYGGIVRVQCLQVAREYDASRGIHLLSILLPSGRKLFYLDPQVGENRWGQPSITYMGANQSTKKWEQVETYGGKLVENCVQAIARDCLADAIERLEAAGYPIVFHVHDEVVIDIKPFGTDEEMLNAALKIMTQPIPWAQGLPLNADGWVGEYFRKD